MTKTTHKLTAKASASDPSLGFRKAINSTCPPLPASADEVSLGLVLCPDFAPGLGATGQSFLPGLLRTRVKKLCITARGGIGHQDLCRPSRTDHHGKAMQCLRGFEDAAICFEQGRSSEEHVRRSTLTLPLWLIVFRCKEVTAGSHFSSSGLVTLRLRTKHKTNTADSLYHDLLHEHSHRSTATIA